MTNITPKSLDELPIILEKFKILTIYGPNEQKIAQIKKFLNATFTIKTIVAKDFVNKKIGANFDSPTLFETKKSLLYLTCTTLEFQKIALGLETLKANGTLIVIRLQGEGRGSIGIQKVLESKKHWGAIYCKNDSMTEKESFIRRMLAFKKLHFNKSQESLLIENLSGFGRLEIENEITKLSFLSDAQVSLDNLKNTINNSKIFNIDILIDKIINGDIESFELLEHFKDNIKSALIVRKVLYAAETRAIEPLLLAQVAKICLEFDVLIKKNQNSVDLFLKIFVKNIINVISELRI